MTQDRSGHRYVLCVSNRGYEVSLEPRKVYVRLPDRKGDQAGMIRVIDESEEDYLFPAELFVEIKLPAEAEKRFTAP